MKHKTEEQAGPSPRAMECAAEFGRSGKGTRLLLTAFGSLLKVRKELHQASRLNARMLKVLQSDPVNGRGERIVPAGDMTLLEGFDFYNKKPLLRLLMAPFHASIDRVAGHCTIHVPGFDALEGIRYDGNYTHLVFIAGSAVLDFDRENFMLDTVRTECLDIRQPIEVTLQTLIPARCKQPVVLALGLEFYQVVNGQSYIMSRNGPLSLHIVRTDQAGRRHLQASSFDL